MPGRRSPGEWDASGSAKLRALVRPCRRYRSLIALTAAGMLAVSAATVVFPLVQRAFIDDTIVARTTPAWHLATALIATAVIGCSGLFLRRYCGAKLSLAVQHDLRRAMFGTVMHLDGAQQDQLDTGQLVSSSIADIAVVQGFLLTVPQLASGALQLGFALVIMVTLSPLLSLVVLAVVPVLWLVARASGRRIYPASLHARQQGGEIAAIVDRVVTGVRLVKGFGQEQRETAQLEAAATRLFASRMRVVRLVARFTPALAAIPMVGQVGVLALGGWLALRGSITLGTFFAFAVYLALVSAQVRILASGVLLGQQTRASLTRILEATRARPLITSPPAASHLPGTAACVELDDVGFGYQASAPVLRGLSLRVEAGETVALFGAGGCGTSTITQLLARFYDVEAGAVRIGGYDVRELSLDSLRSTVRLVMADSFLFAGTIRTAIAFGRPDAPLEAIAAAASAAGAAGFISELPHAYDTEIGERGLTLSAGQRQRIALAQALLCDPPVLVLDDATSALDARTEAQVLASLCAAPGRRTTIVVAHRAGPLRLADRIAVLSDGRVTDIGSHHELIGRCAAYQDLLADPQQGHDDVAHRPVALASAPAAERPAATAAAMIDELPPARDLPAPGHADQAAGDPAPTLYRLLRPLARVLVAGLVLDALDVLAGLVLPLLVRTGIDRGVTARALSLIVVVSAVSLAIVAIDWLVNVAQTVLVGRMGEQALYNLRVAMFRHLQRLGLDYYEQERTGAIMTRMTSDVDTLSTFAHNGLITMVNSVLTVAGIMAALLVIDPAVGLIALAVTPAVGVATVIFRRASARAYGAARELLAALNADLQENVAGTRVVQAYRAESRSLESFARRSDAYRVAQLRGERCVALYFPFVQLAAMLAGVLALVVAAGQVHRGTLMIGGVIAYLVYLNMFFAPLQQLSQVYDGYQRSAVGLRRIATLLRTPSGLPRSPRALRLSQPKRPGPGAPAGQRIELRDVQFRYNRADRNALRGINLTIEPGETVALVGQTGAGKSTVIKLIARFYDVTSGAITVNGEDLRDYDLTDYRRRIGMVAQEGQLFPGTVRDVITYGRPDASDAEVEAAALAVGAHEMLARLPGGFGYRVGQNGQAISSGQRQLLALARAYLMNPAILLLDEATAVLDPATERAVLAGTEKIIAERTAILVAHRLTTADRADRVVVLHAGRIVESGSPAVLLAAGGAYAALYAAADGEPAGPDLAGVA